MDSSLGAFLTLETEYGPVHYLFQRSARRTLTIHVIDPDAKVSRRNSLPGEYLFPGREIWVRVAAPLRMPEERVHAFIRLKARWINSKINQIRERRAKFPVRQFRQGEQFLFLGKRYPLNITHEEVRRPGMIFNEEGWKVTLSQKTEAPRTDRLVRKKLFDWYRDKAKEFLGSRIFYFARLLGSQPRKISIRTQKRMWGSCHYHQQAIHLNWQLIQAPVEVIDYVIVHEFCHLKVPNHSRRFWKEVRKVLPGFEVQRRWLKEHQWELSLPE